MEPKVGKGQGKGKAKGKGTRKRKLLDVFVAYAQKRFKASQGEDSAVHQKQQQQHHHIIFFINSTP